MTNLEKLDKLIGQQEAAVAKAFREFLAAMKSPEIIAELTALIENNAIAEALAVVDSYIARFADILPLIQQTVGLSTAAELSEIMPDVFMAIGFDPSNPRAAQMIQAQRLSLIRELSEKQRNATRQAIARSFQNGEGNAAMARSFRASIGLTRSQEAAVYNYRKYLEGLDSKALNLAHRDRRFDRTVLAAIRRKRPLTKKQIANMVARLRAIKLAARAETIARTEAIRATSLAREESLAQMIEQAGIDHRRIERTWHPTGDKRTRDHHHSMDGQIRPYGVPFEDGLGNRLRYPGDRQAPPITTINCRCAVTFAIKKP